MAHRIDRKNQATQVQYPWRATLRAVICAALGLLPLLPEIARAAGVETIPWVVSTLAVTAAIQRVLTLPAVDAWLSDNLHLGAKPKGH